MESDYPRDWQTLPLEECMSAIIDYRGKTPEKRSYGVPLITAKIVKGGRIEEPEEFIAEEDYESWMRRGLPEPGDVLVTTEAPLGEVAQLDGRRVALAQRLIGLRGKKGLLDNRFLKYLMQSATVKQELLARATGTTVVGIRQSELRRVSLTFPGFREQQAIGSILGDLDDKMEANRRVNRTLEGIARVVFKSWFVDFDPVRAKADGRTPVGLDPATSALFPDRFEDSALGPIPAGWTVEPLDNVANFLNGLALQKYPPVEGESALPVIKIAQLRAGHTVGADQANCGVPPAYVVEDGDLLFSWSGSLLVDIWCGGRGALNQHLFKVTSSRFPRWLIHRWVLEHLQEFQAIAADKATTMGHIQRKHLSQAMVVVPSDSVIKAAGEVLGDLQRRQLASGIDSRTLATLRDALLPKLISGEVRVPA